MLVTTCFLGFVVAGSCRPLQCHLLWHVSLSQHTLSLLASCEHTFLQEEFATLRALILSQLGEVLMLQVWHQQLWCMHILLSA